MLISLRSQNGFVNHHSRDALPAVCDLVARWSAADAFEHGYAPWIITDASASDAGPDVHDAGLVVARRLIGAGQLVTADHVMGQLAACTDHSAGIAPWPTHRPAPVHPRASTPT